MTTLDTLLAGQLRAICEDPGDDGARLVYADILEEYGNESDLARATFIRVQCEIACIPPANRDCSLNPGLQDAFANYRKRCRCHWCSLRRKEYLVACRYISVDWEAKIRQPIAEAEVNTALKSGRMIRRVWFEPAPSFVWRRGFIAEVHCTLADWIGGGTSCIVCDGSPHNPPHNYNSCDACGGTGKPPGYGPQIVACQPVEVVRVMDREPFNNSWTTDYKTAPWHLPEEIYRLVRGQSSGGWKRFRDAEAAHAALSTALIAWAKEER